MSHLNSEYPQQATQKVFSKCANLRSSLYPLPSLPVKLSLIVSFLSLSACWICGCSDPVRLRVTSNTKYWPKTSIKWKSWMPHCEERLVIILFSARYHKAQLKQCFPNFVLQISTYWNINVLNWYLLVN